jgi:hypothetical protein
MDFVQVYFSDHDLMMDIPLLYVWSIKVYGSEAVGLNVTNLLSRVIHSSNSESFELHDLDVLRNFGVRLKNAFDSATTKNAMGKSNRLVIDCIESTVTTTVTTVLNEVLNFVAKSVSVLFGPVSLNVGTSTTLLANYQFVLSSPVPTERITLEAGSRIDFNLNTGTSGSLSKADVSTVKVPCFSSGRNYSSGCGESGESESFEVFHDCFF